MKKKRVILAGILGNILEFYDFTLYGVFVPILAHLFFPKNNSYLALLASFGIFATGFFSRPLGGIFFGHLGDKWGRKNALITSILCMTCATSMIGMLPSYEQIGFYAPLLLVICRLLQGFSAGGEYNGSAIFIIEHLNDKNTGFIGSLLTVSCWGGVLFATIMGILALKIPSVEWGWRVAFLLGGPLGAIAFYIRKKIEETPEFINENFFEKSYVLPFKNIIIHHKKKILFTMFIGSLASALTNLFVTYINVYLTTILNIELFISMVFNICMILLIIITMPIMGFISDKIGHRKFLIISNILIILLIVPIFVLFQKGVFLYVAIAQITLAILISMYSAPTNAFINKLFPVSIRYSGVAFSYSCGMAFFGGSMPLISTFLIKATGYASAPALYLLLCSIMSLVALVLSNPSRSE